MISRFVLTRRVLFHETDLAGVVHFSCYLRYMEEAEHAMWRAAGLSIAPRGADIGWPRVAVSCVFRQPLYFEDEFEVHIRIVAMSARTIRYVCALAVGDRTIADGEMTVACVSQRPGEPMRAVAIPSDVLARLAVDSGAQGGA